MFQNIWNRIGAVIAQSGVCNTLNFVAVNFGGIGGDSGAPIFSTPAGSDNVSFYGIVAEQWSGDPQHVLLYSPWESIQADLNVQ